MRKLWDILIIVVFALSVLGQAQQEESLRLNRPFRIGFLRLDEEQPLGLDWYESLKRFFLKQPSLQLALKEKGFTGIAILPADGYRDMLQRMDHNEFDLAFCSSVIFVEQAGDYGPILQLRSEIFDSRGQGMTFHKGVVIVGNHCPLFGDKEPTPEEVRKYVTTHPMAFVSAHNATGYVYPRLVLWRNYGVREPGDFIFCGSSEEVVKYVVNGLVDIGACDRDTLDAVCRSYCPDVEPHTQARILFETPPAPTSPIVIRAALHPQKSRLGRIIKGVLKIFYNNSKRPGVPRVADSRDENFKNLREEIKAFHKLTENSPLTSGGKSAD